MEISFVELILAALLVLVVVTLMISGAIASRRWGLLMMLALLLGAVCGGLLFGIFTLRVQMSRTAAIARMTERVHTVASRTTRAVTSSPVDEAVANSIATPVVEAAVANQPVGEHALSETAVTDEMDDPAIVLEDGAVSEDGAGQAAKAERPAWVEQGRVQAGEVLQVAIASGPEEKLAESRAALDRQLQHEVAAYIDEYLGPDATGKCRPSDIVTYDVGSIKKRLIKPGNIFEEKLQLSFGPMYQTHALLELGPDFRRELDGRRAELEQYVREVTIAQRLRGLIVAFGAVFGLLAIGFVCFRRAARPSVSQAPFEK
jgi:hypothetical protein